MKNGHNDTKHNLNKGQVYYGLARYSEALEILDQDLKIDPNHICCFCQKGAVLDKLTDMPTMTKKLSARDRSYLSQ